MRGAALLPIVITENKPLVSHFLSRGGAVSHHEHLECLLELIAETGEALVLQRFDELVDVDLASTLRAERPPAAHREELL